MQGKDSLARVVGISESQHGSGPGLRFCLYGCVLESGDSEQGGGGGGGKP